jgi:undecaprenyl phosphate N,N'-diacetylbacillosamine 1-phosphate transferase
MKLYRHFGKRILDMTVAFLLLLLCSPVFLVTTLWLVAVNGGRPFFFQDRPGLQGKAFRLIKFRTMNDARDDQGKLLSDDRRITRSGRVIRALSLDEIPQLVNVLTGKMSLVGPRPLLVKYLPLYTDEQARRHEVRPGITGLAQVNGRNVLTWEERFKYDVRYVDSLSLGLDLGILWKTLVNVIRRQGIYPAPGKVMGPFTGSPGKSTIIQN